MDGNGDKTAEVMDLIYETGGDNDPTGEPLIASHVNPIDNGYVRAIATPDNGIVGDTTQFFLDIQIPVSEFPARMFGSQFEGFRDCFYAPINNYIVFGNSADVLKSLNSDISEQNTWGKSVRISQFLENTQKRSNKWLLKPIYL